MTHPSIPVNETPFDLDAERVVLAAIFQRGFDVLPDAAPASAHCFSDSHATIFAAAAMLRDRGDVVNSFTISRALGDCGNLERAGGVAYLASLEGEACFDSLLQTACQIIADKLREREIQKATRDFLIGIDHGDPETAFELFNRRMNQFQVSKRRAARIKFYSPSELAAFEPPAGSKLIGDNHILRGEVFVIGGEPGVGKSTAATELAICGATGRDWLGLKVHSRFKTLIIQNENGRYRLMTEYRARGVTSEIEAAIRVSEPPPYGMTLDNPEFLREVKSALNSFGPDVVVFDPWNCAARDDKARDYSTAFDALRRMLPTGPKRPALGIVAHTRKPSLGERGIGGAGLMHALAGSYILTSVPRAIFIMTRGNALDESDDSVCWFNPKNSNGPCVSRSAWRRGPEGFTALPDFDWSAFEGDSAGRRVVEFSDIEEALGNERLKRPEAVKQLMKATGLGERACQKALAEDGKFADLLEFKRGFVCAL